MTPRPVARFAVAPLVGKWHQKELMWGDGDSSDSEAGAASSSSGYSSEEGEICPRPPPGCSEFLGGLGVSHSIQVSVSMALSFGRAERLTAKMNGDDTGIPRTWLVG